MILIVVSWFIVFKLIRPIDELTLFLISLVFLFLFLGEHTGYRDCYYVFPSDLRNIRGILGKLFDSQHKNLCCSFNALFCFH